jgi:competence ComEA-like helix-hairpin-helix protein
VTERIRIPHTTEAVAWAQAHAAAVALLGVVLLLGTAVGRLTGAGQPFPAGRVEAPQGATEISAAVASATEFQQPSGPAAAPAVLAADGSHLDINRADGSGLQELPGIGPVLAERIVAYREAHGPFQRLEDLRDVPGIGPKRFTHIRPLIRIGEGP